MSNQDRIKFSLVLLMVFSAVMFIVDIQAKVEEPQTPERLNPERFEPLPYLETGFTAQNISSPDSLDITTWGKVAFQSYRDGNWEIYTMKDDGSNQLRITNHLNSDIHPRFNRGNTYIAFASNRDGDYEIYVVNADGSGLKQLTFNTTDDVNPTWSYDGTKLAFQAYRDGQAEIYTMNVDGTAQNRLTINEAYEGTPAWSPDGQKIAFVSNRSGGYRIFVMNSQNGSGQTQLSNQPNSFNPTWSPDGTQMSYDADGDGDGWQDLWLMNVDGSNQRVHYNPPGQVDAWARSWFGKYLIAFTEISFIQYQGNWYWTQAFTSYTLYDSSITDKFNANYITDWNPDWQSSDAQPPITRVSRAPLFLQQDNRDDSVFSATCWEISDAGGSGADTVEVEYRHETEESWTFYQNFWEVESFCYHYSPYSVGDNRFGWFEYRSRGFDNAYNFEPWPSKSQTRTLVYEWRVDSTTQDVRGNYLENVNIAAPNLMHQTHNPELKKQTFYFPEPVQPTIGWSSNGSLSLPDTTYFLHQDFLVETDLYFPAADNLINDWGFESNDLSLAWGVSAANSAGSTTLYHSGGVSALFDAKLRAISQTVTIPNNMTNPTLSFMHLGYSEDNAVVTITNGISSTSLSFLTLGNWRQSWIDMSPWLGETITLTLSNEAPDDSFYIDEVTLGSAYPNVWVDLAGNSAAFPGEQLTYKISFGNQTNLNALTNTITLTLPSSVDFVSASVPPTVNGNILSWDIGDLLAESTASPIFVDTSIKLLTPLRTTFEAQVAIDSETPELILENNIDVFTTFVGDLLHLPLVTRN